MYKFLYAVFFIGVTLLGWFLTDYLYRKIGFLVILTPGPLLVGYGLMSVARFKKY
ncbi:hypothetical protein GCM10028803_00690 [Larkinella knui]